MSVSVQRRADIGTVTRSQVAGSPEDAPGCPRWALLGGLGLAMLGLTVGVFVADEPASSDTVPVPAFYAADDTPYYRPAPSAECNGPSYHYETGIVILSETADAAGLYGCVSFNPGTVRLAFDIDGPLSGAVERCALRGGFVSSTFYTDGTPSVCVVPNP